MRKILVIAGSDSGGGAGIQADIKTITTLKAYASTAIVAITTQNTVEVRSVIEIAPSIVKEQISMILDDIGADTIKIGMLGSKAIILAVKEVLSDVQTPIILDPVMISKSGARLLSEDAIDSLISDLIPLAYLVTPNIPEAEAIVGMKINHIGDMIIAGQNIINMGAQNVLIKGGHLDTDELKDVLITKDTNEIDIKLFKHKKIVSNNTHGTGCTLASAIATYIAKGYSIKRSVVKAKKYLLGAIRKAPNIGKGSGPVNHVWHI